MLFLLLPLTIIVVYSLAYHTRTPRSLTHSLTYTHTHSHESRASVRALENVIAHREKKRRALNTSFTWFKLLVVVVVVAAVYATAFIHTCAAREQESTRRRERPWDWASKQCKYHGIDSCCFSCLSFNKNTAHTTHTYTHTHSHTIHLYPNTVGEKVIVVMV